MFCSFSEPKPAAKKAEKKLPTAFANLFGKTDTKAAKPSRQTEGHGTKAQHETQGQTKTSKKHKKSESTGDYT